MNRDSILIEADELLTKLEDGNIRIYDATILFHIGEADPSGLPTGYDQYLQGHIPGAAFFDHQDFSDSSTVYMYMVLRETDLATQIGNIGISEDDEVMAAMADGGVCTVNTLDLDSYEDAHIVGSSCLPCVDLMQEMDSFLPDDALASRLKEESQNERIITYCGGGIAATVNAIAHLIAGNENVAVYDGSMSEWVGEGLPTSKGGML